MYQQPMQPMQPMIQQQPQSVEAIRHTVQKMDPQQTAEVLSYLKVIFF
jgi:ABC-type dipeptide/oligopeptide/nickel transport system ATPase component